MTHNENLSNIMPGGTQEMTWKIFVTSKQGKNSSPVTTKHRAQHCI